MFRIWFGEATDPPRDEVAARLTRMGALLEWQSRETRNLLAVDTVDLSNAQRVADVPAECQRSGSLIFEPGRSA